MFKYLASLFKPAKVYVDYVNPQLMPKPFLSIEKVDELFLVIEEHNRGYTQNDTIGLYVTRTDIIDVVPFLYHKTKEVRA